MSTPAPVPVSPEAEPRVIKLLEGNSSIRIFDQIPECYHLSDDEFKRVWSLHPEERGIVKVFGKEHKTPRWMQSFGVPYKFSGVNHEAVPLTDPFLLKLKWMVETYTRFEYKQWLVNWYQDGKDKIGKHSDDETEIIPGSSIFSFSFGSERDIIFRSKKTDEKHTILMKNNSLIIMEGETNLYYTHEVPQRLKVLTPRINVTARRFK